MDTRSFVLAGNATFTVKSLRTSNHLTFKVEKPTETAPHFVSVLTGNDNENDFTFLGTIFPSGDFRHGKKSRISADAESAKGFDWIWKNIGTPEKIAKAAEFLPASKCCRCGRKLTVPSSIENAVGPECAKKMGF